MPLVDAKCPNCGAKINIDSTKEAGICQYCNSAFITEKAIQNYQIINYNTISGQNVNINQEVAAVYETKVETVAEDGRQRFIEVRQCFGWEVLSISGNDITFRRNRKRANYDDLVQMEIKFTDVCNDMAKIDKPLSCTAIGCVAIVVLVVAVPSSGGASIGAILLIAVLVFFGALYVHRDSAKEYEDALHPLAQKAAEIQEKARKLL